MSETNAAPANGEAAAPAASAPADEQVTSGTASVTPQEGTSSADTSDGERPSRARERIEELSAQVKAAVAYGDFFRQQLEEQQRKAQVATSAPQEPAPDPEPQADQFDDVTAYVKAHAVWARKEAIREAKREAAATAQQVQTNAEKAMSKAREEERLKTLDSGFQTRSYEFADKNPDYYTAISNPALTFFNGDFLEAIKSHEMGPQIAYAIAKDPKLVAKLASRTVPQRLAELGRIEAELSRPAPPPKVTAAPAPPTPVGGGSGGEPDPSKMSMTDWMAWRNKQDPRLARFRR